MTLLRIQKTTLPEHALLKRYERDGHYTDCYTTDVDFGVAHDEFVFAFYTTWLFKLERLILQLLISRPSTDNEALALAQGERDAFAAWTVEGREADQLLMCDVMERTRSWLMVEALDSGGTRLSFGSAVVRDDRLEQRPAKLMFKPLILFHRAYSVALLAAARRILRRDA